MWYNIGTEETMRAQDDKTILQIKLERDLHHRFKVICTERRTTMQDAITEFIRSQVWHAKEQGK